MEKTKALERLKTKRDMIDHLKSIRRGSSELQKWHRDTQVAIERIFGTDSRHVEDFNNIRYSLRSITSRTPEQKLQNYYIRGLDGAHAILTSF